MMGAFGAGQAAAEIVADLRRKLAGATGESRIAIAAALHELVTEIGSGTKSIVLAMREERAAYRQQLTEIVGNAVAVDVAEEKPMQRPPIKPIRIHWSDVTDEQVAARHAQIVARLDELGAEAVRAHLAVDGLPQIWRPIIVEWLRAK
jgi:hypothetical protein